MSNSSNTENPGFMESITGIKKLKQDRVDLFQDRPRKTNTIKKHWVSHAHEIDYTVKDSTPANTPDSWFHHGIQKKQQRKIKSGQLTIDAVLDLHGYRQWQASHVLESFLHQALDSQLKFLLIIHGKGYRSQSQAKLRPLVQYWLYRQPMVLAFCPAKDRDGGMGASYVYLKRA